MKNIKFISFITIILFSLCLALPVLAVEATSSATDDEVKAKIKERLEQVATEDFAQVKGEMEAKAGQVYAWVGTTEEISQPILSILTSDGQKQAKIASSAAILKVLQGQGKKTITEEEIKTGQYIIVMGPKDENGAIIAKRVIIQDQAPTASVKREVISGKITEVDGDKIAIKKNGDSAAITIGAKTKLKVVGLKTSTTDDIQVNDYASAIVTLDKNDKISLVKTVMVVPGATNPEADVNKVNKESSASASPKATSSPKASPKKSPSPSPEEE